MKYDDLINELLEILHVIRNDGFWGDEEATVETLQKAGVSQDRIDRM